MIIYGGAKVQLHVFSTLALDGGEWSASYPRGKSPPLFREIIFVYSDHHTKSITKF
jgi:hypothetical protein